MGYGGDYAGAIFYDGYITTKAPICQDRSCSLGPGVGYGPQQFWGTIAGLYAEGCWGEVGLWRWILFVTGWEGGHL
jgi:hypothetical protein